MIPSINYLNGKTVEQILTNHSSTGVYGPKTLALLNTLGWPIPSNPDQSTKLYIHQDEPLKKNSSFRFAKDYFLIVIGYLIFELVA